MPKKKYLIANKKVSYEEKDPFYYNSPGLAKIVAKKFGRSTKFLEDAFNQYFEALNFLGITEFMPVGNIKQIIKDLEFDFDSSLSKTTLGETDVLDDIIFLRKSFKINNHILFHEFSHLISKSYKKRPIDKDTCLIVSSGYAKIYTQKVIENNLECLNLGESLRFMNEGVTDLLACFTTSYINKEYVRINNSYNKVTKYMQLLYAICGKNLFEGFFGEGLFEPIIYKLGIEEENLNYLTGLIENLMMIICPNSMSEESQQTEEPIDEKLTISKVVDLDYNINLSLINLFCLKMKNQILENISQYNYANEVYSSLFDSFLDFGKLFYFGGSSLSPLNLNKDPVFVHLASSFRETIVSIKESIKEKNVIKGMEPEKIKIINSLKVPKDDELWAFYECADAFNKYNYGFIHYLDSEILPTDYLNGKPITTMTDLNKNSYINKKAGFEDANTILSEETIENLKNEYPYLEY